jgi:hypothetical protein
MSGIEDVQRKPIGLFKYAPRCPRCLLQDPCQDFITVNDLDEPFRSVVFKMIRDSFTKHEEGQSV